MDAATKKQKAYIKGLFVKCGVPKWVFNPLKLWNISKSDADLLINGLRVMKKFDHGDLKEAIWLGLQEKRAISVKPRTIEQLEEEAEQATYDPTCEDWLDQQFYNNYISQKDWIQESQADILREQEAVA
jgi:hypothetical protein